MVLKSLLAGQTYDADSVAKEASPSKDQRENTKDPKPRNDDSDNHDEVDDIIMLMKTTMMK